jgi:hypothetical protein
MARIKKTEIETEKTVKEEAINKEVANVETTTKTTDKVGDEGSADVNAELLSLVVKLRQEVAELKKNQIIAEELPTAELIETKEDTTKDALVNYLLNNKSNKEVTIVHTQEMKGGLKTEIQLSTLSISFQHIGEQRVLSWQQFEELVSKYRSFLDEGIVMLPIEHEDLCEKYSIQCFSANSGEVLTNEIIKNIGNLSSQELEKCYNKLNPNSQKFLLSYWLGKCYDRDKDPKFYDRYKIETLNRLSNSYIFDNVLAEMNFAYSNNNNR